MYVPSYVHSSEEKLQQKPTRETETEWLLLNLCQILDLVISFEIRCSNKYLTI